MITLAIDTSNDELGIAITYDQAIKGELIMASKQNHSTKLMPAIVELMEKTETKPTDLQAIIATHGPGSYTGSRIGLTTAKTMAWGLDIPLYTVSSLALLAMNGRLTSYYICPFYNARREAVFTSLYKWENDALVEVKQEKNVSMEEWMEELKTMNEPILFVSPHMDLFESMITEKLGNRAILADAPLSRALPSNMHIMARTISPTNVHSTTPNYLRKTEAEAKLLKEQKGVSHG